MKSIPQAFLATLFVAVVAGIIMALSQPYGGILLMVVGFCGIFRVFYRIFKKD